MAHTKILVVEDERDVAADIRNRLKILGYPYPATASSGMEAIERAAEYRPDLVLIDIQLKGEMDGIKAARQIHDRFNIPVLYLMDDADEETLKDDKLIEPFYYVLKPCEELTLHVSIEKAIYKHKMGRVWRSFSEQKVRKEASKVRTTRSSPNEDAIIKNSYETSQRRGRNFGRKDLRQPF